jgi:hypothetical protein
VEALVMWTKWTWFVTVMLVAGCTASDGSDIADTSTTFSATTTTAPVATTTEASTTAASATTLTTTSATTLPKPPLLRVSDPAFGATVATHVYTFRGVTDPGCTVSVGGKYFADVDADGNWTLDLVLRPGGNTTTITATDVVGVTTQTRISVTHAPITLAPNGLGVVTFGDPADDVIAALTGFFGPPDTDSTSQRTDDLAPPGGVCGGGYACWDYVRWASWDSAGLWLVFSDLWWQPGGDTPPPRVPMTFVGYGSTGVFQTEEGVGVGSTVADLEAVYGPALTVGIQEDLPYFAIHLDEHDTPYGGSGYWGFWADDPTHTTRTVTHLNAGAPSS